MSEISSLLYVACCAGVVLFQIALIIGAPWGRYTQGGQNDGPLPIPNRIIAFVSIFLLSAMAGSALSMDGQWPSWPAWTGWAKIALQCLSTIMNWITPSAEERRVWGPFTTLMLILILITWFTP